jgi:hypothetical protein
MAKIPRLTTKQQAYCYERANGVAKARSYLNAGYKANNIEDAGSAACVLEKNPLVSSMIDTLRESSFVKQALSIAEKRAFLARAVRTPVRDVNSESDLCQEYKVTTLETGQVVESVKMVDKLKAIEVDSKIAGDFYADRSPQVQNPFMFLVALDSGSVVLQETNSVPELGVVGVESEIIDEGIDIELV